jgi:acyl-CoA thioester hydrolase
MIHAETKFRVRYAETDQMGYVYYGRYAEYYEVGRVEAMRLLGFSYKDVEDRGILMPVIDLHIHYKKPALYDDELTLHTFLPELPQGYRITFTYETRNAKNDLLNTGSVSLVFVDKQSNKMVKIPDWFHQALKPFFKANP